MISALIVAETITFLLATLLHVGIPVPLGFTQPRIIPAAIVKGLCGIFLATPPSLTLMLTGVTLLVIATALILTRHRLQIAWKQWV